MGNELQDVLSRLSSLCAALHDSFLRKCNELIVIHDFLKKHNDPCLAVLSEYMEKTHGKMTMNEIEANDIRHILETIAKRQEKEQQ